MRVKTPVRGGLGGGGYGPIGLISAVPFEAASFIEKLKGKPLQGKHVTGRLGRNPVVYVASGIGVANAAHAATLLVERFSPRLIINFGIGGAYPSSGLKQGDIAVAEKEVYADAGLLLKEGFYGMEAIGIPLFTRGKRRYFNEFPMDKGLLRAALKITGASSGVFLTVSASTGTLKRALELKRRYNGLCENMEGASVAHISALYGVPMLELRGISNMVGDRETRGWDKDTASKRCQAAVLEVLGRL